MVEVVVKVGAMVQVTPVHLRSSEMCKYCYCLSFSLHFAAAPSNLRPSLLGVDLVSAVINTIGQMCAGMMENGGAKGKKSERLLIIMPQ